MHIGIIGNGFIGKATSILGKSSKDITSICYDIKSELCKPSGTTMDDIVKCDMIFICVPTPMGFNGKCQVENVSNIVKNLRQLNFKGYIIIRSTVPTGTTKSLGCYNMPEFITEKSYDKEFINTPHRIVGINDNLPDSNSFKDDIQKLKLS